MIPTGTTRVVSIVGHPIGQVRSPELFNARFEALGTGVVLIPVDIQPAALPGFLAVLRGWENCDGCVVTVPFKRKVVAFLDTLTERAQRLYAVNVIRRGDDGHLAGDMVDGLGFVAAARAHGFRVPGRTAAVLGAGGAGSAIADALCAEGLARIAVTDLDDDRAEWLRDMLAATFEEVEVGLLADGHLGGFDLVVNASPAGMGSAATLPVEPAALDTLDPSTLVADVVTSPPVTPFLAAARQRGCKVQTGPEMAAGQTELLGRFLRVLA